MRPSFSAFVALASRATAQIVTVSTTNSDPIQLSGTSNTETSSGISITSATATTTHLSPLGPILPTNLPTIRTISNHVPFNHTPPFSGACAATLTTDGEPIFSIQTDTALQSGPCTYTVFNPTAPPSANRTVTGPTTTTTATSIISSSSTSAAAATAGTSINPGGTLIPVGGAGVSSSSAAPVTSQSGSPADQLTVAAGGDLGLLAVVGAAVLLL